MHLNNKKDLIDKLSIIGIRVLFAVSLIMGFVLILFGGYSLYEQMYTQNRAFSTSLGIDTEEVYSVEVQENLASQREGYRAWLTINNTEINYPVMQADDDLYYAYHDINDNTSLGGAIYLAAANKADLSDDYIVIYGHHMDNGAMFGDLDRFLDKDFFNQNTGGKFVSPNGSYILKLWAVVTTDAYEDEVYDVGSNGFDDVVKYVNANALNINASALENAKKIVALSTCKGTTTNGRLVVFFTLCEDEPAPTPTPVNPTNPTNPDKPTTDDTTTNNEITTPGKDDTTPDDGGDDTPDIPVKPDNPDKPDNPKPDDNTPPDTDKPGEDEKVPPVPWLVPSGSSYGIKAWALVNLIILVVTIYVLVPIFFLRKKYGRIHKMRKVNKAKTSLFEAQDMSPADWAEREKIMLVAHNKTGRSDGYISKEQFGAAVEELFFKVKSFTIRFIIGVILEVILSVASLIVFLLTQDLRLPMVLIDQWTPLMLVLLVCSVLIEFFLTRYKRKNKKYKDLGE